LTAKKFGLNLQLRFIFPVIVILLVLGCSSVRDDAFLGTVLTESPKATDFSLIDQFGETVSLSDYQHKVVILTFVYTACNDICPSIAHGLINAEKYLIDENNEIATLLISVDPLGDTVNSAKEFLQDYGMLNKWQYLLGKEEDLEPIWAAYYISASIKELDSTFTESNSKDELQTQLLKNYSVNHQGPVYIIDRTGNARSVFTFPFDPEELANDVKLLLEEN